MWTVLSQLSVSKTFLSLMKLMVFLSSLASYKFQKPQTHSRYQTLRSDQTHALTMQLRLLGVWLTKLEIETGLRTAIKVCHQLISYIDLCLTIGSQSYGIKNSRSSLNGLFSSWMELKIGLCHPKRIMHLIYGHVQQCHGNTNANRMEKLESLS